MRSMLNINNKPLDVEVASDENSRAYGLMNRSSLPWNSGMLFVHETPEIANYYMKNTNFPLSIAFLDESGKILEIKHMKPRDLSTTTSSLPIKYALEVNKGWFEENRITAGDYVIGNVLT